MLRIVHTGCGAVEGIAASEPEITVFRGIRRTSGRRSALVCAAAGRAVGGHAGGT